MSVSFPAPPLRLFPETKVLDQSGSAWMIVEVTIDQDSNSEYFSEWCYLLQSVKGNHMRTFPTDELHRLWDIQLGDGTCCKVQDHLAAQQKLLSDRRLSVDEKEEQRLCAHCQKPNTTTVCGRCGKVRYCSVECQKAEWKIHKKRCDADEN
jgi:hypothetical protein